MKVFIRLSIWQVKRDRSPPLLVLRESCHVGWNVLQQPDDDCEDDCIDEGDTLYGDNHDDDDDELSTLQWSVMFPLVCTWNPWGPGVRPNTCMMNDDACTEDDDDCGDSAEDGDDAEDEDGDVDGGGYENYVDKVPMSQIRTPDDPDAHDDDYHRLLPQW